MSDENGFEDGEGSPSAPEIAADFITGVPVPASVKRNLLKAISRLCSALVDIPVAHLQGKAEERRAVTKARIKLIDTTADRVAEQMRLDPEYARRAISQFGNRILREQVNLDTITRKGIEELNREMPTKDETASDAEISDDWLACFEEEARKKSAEDSQIYFARLLAGEIRKPNSFSLKAVKTLGEMDQEIAKAFRRLCSMSVILGDLPNQVIEIRVLSLGGNASNNSLEQYGLPFNLLNLLNEYGLIISDFNSWRDYQVCIGLTVSLEGGQSQTVRLPIVHQAVPWILQPLSGRKPSTQFKVHGVALTQTGQELLKVVELEAVDKYTSALKEYFRRNQLDMIKLAK